MMREHTSVHMLPKSPGSDTDYFNLWQAYLYSPRIDEFRWYRERSSKTKAVHVHDASRQNNCRSAEKCKTGLRGTGLNSARLRSSNLIQCRLQSELRNEHARCYICAAVQV
jgi:hypothetical protein